jgi:hypothetical protein
LLDPILRDSQAGSGLVTSEGHEEFSDFRERVMKVETGNAASRSLPGPSRSGAV